MRHITIRPHLTIEEIAQRRDETREARQLKRWQVIYLAAQGGWTCARIALTVGVPKRTVEDWILRYNHSGPEEYVLKKQGGDHRRLLTDAQEKTILSSLSESAIRGEVVTVHVVRSAVETTLGRTVGKDFPYRMLRRQKWRKVAPRPEHPRKDREAQETFKKNSRP